MSMRMTILSALAGGMLLVAGMAVPGQDQGAPNSETQALTSAAESTVSRRLLMWSIGAHNDIVHDILDGALPQDDLELRGRLQSISAMLYAFPSLYRAAPNPYDQADAEADAARVSLANPRVWQEFETFKELSYQAYFKAQEAADAAPEDILARVEELEVMCDSCHETYRQPFEYFDFDRIEDFIQ